MNKKTNRSSADILALVALSVLGIIGALLGVKGQDVYAVIFSIIIGAAGISVLISDARRKNE